MGSKMGKHEETRGDKIDLSAPVSSHSGDVVVDGGESEKSPHDLWRNDNHYAGSPAHSESPSRAVKHSASGSAAERTTTDCSPEAEFSKRKRAMQHIAQNVVLEDYVRGRKGSRCISGVL
jgi:hypothetical protein